MLKPLPLAGICLLFTTLFSSPAFAQLSGTKHIPGDYATISAAVTALNAAGVGSGGVTFDIAAGYTETLLGPIALTATGTVANPIVFQKDPATVGANPKLTAYVGTATPASAIQDGFWRLQGSDFVTISSIDLNDPNSTNPATMEYGYALYKTSTINGSQNVTIQNCVITMSRVNDVAGAGPMTEGSAGIIMMSAIATTAATNTGSTSLAGANSNNKFYGNTIQNVNHGIVLIGAVVTSPYTNADINNDIGGASAGTGNIITNFGGIPGATTQANGIRTLSQYGVNIANNTINSNDGTGGDHPNILRGIYSNTAAGASATISNNTITIKGGGTTQAIAAIENIAGSTANGNTITISGNTIINGTYTTATAGTFYGVHNTGAPANLAITNNTFQGNSTAATTGSFWAINNGGIVTTSISITGNQVGNSTAGPVTFTSANATAQLMITNTAGAATAALSISNNNFQGISYSTAASAASTFISNGAATLSQTISNNTFTNLNINTTGNVIFMTNNIALSSSGTQNINSNSIVGTFTKAAGGTVTLYTSILTSASGGVSNMTGNNFSGITLTGATTMAGWVNTDGGSATKTISGNTFSNWTVGTNAATAMTVNLANTTNSISNNTIFNISGAGNITGITVGTGNNNVFGNNIHTLSTTGGSTIAGIAINAGTSNHVYSNKIYDLTLNNASAGTANGITVTGTTVVTTNIYNNVVGDIKAPNTSANGDVVRGIGVTATALNSTINVYYNTIYINATSTGTNFSTTGLYHTSNATLTTAKLDLRNNIIVNTSTPNGSGRAVAYRRSSSALGNYAPTSNNNLLFAGVPGTTHLLFYDATNLVSTMAAYKTLMGSIDSNSISEDVTTKFLSTSGASSSFLHIDGTKTTQVESGGANIATYTTDVDGDVRQGNPGYAGSGTAPDIGADEIDAFKAGGLIGSYNLGTGQQFTSLTGTDGLFANINNLGLAGNTIVNVTSDLAEDGSTALVAWVESGGSGYTLTIQPSSTTVRNITGNVLTGLIRLNGANRVTIDGGAGGTTSYLNFTNSNTAGTTAAAFTFSNGASNNTIKYCGINAATSSGNGVVVFSTSTGTTGNNNNTISNNSITAMVSGNPTPGSVGIYSSGTALKENSGNIISDNYIFNYRDRGLDIQATGSTGWTITGNSFFNGSVSGSITYAATTILYGVRVAGGSGYTIANNYVGGSAALATGTNASYTATGGVLQYDGIFLSTTSASPASVIKGNIISGVNVTCVPNTGAIQNVFFGIETAGSGITIGGTLTSDGNTVGSNTANGAIVISTTTTAILNRSAVRGINASHTGGSILNNHVGSIDINNNGGVNAAPTFFTGVFVNNATAPTPISGNIVGSTGTGAAANSIRVTSTSESTGTTLTGIGVGSAVTSTMLVDGNTVSNMTFVPALATGTIVGVTGINNSGGANSVVTISNNKISNNVTNVQTGGIVGISTTASSTSATINNNLIDANSTTSATTPFFYGITASGGNTPAIAINSNTFSNNAAATTGIYAGIYSTATPATLSINGNTFTGNTSSATGGTFNAIYNAGAVTGSITINSNNIGNASAGPITFSVANTVAQNYIRNGGGAATATLAITSNNFQGINYAIATSGTHTMIVNSAATLSQTITGNTFTNLNVNGTGSFVFISDNVVVSSTGSQTVSSNSIAGTFTKAAGGTVTFFTSTTAASASGAVLNHNNNNFSGITVTGATPIAGWVVTDTGTGTHTVANNTFGSWTGGTSTVTAISTNLSGTSNTVSGNVITSITSGGAVNGILTSGNEAVSLNNIHTLSSSGASLVTAINITAAASGTVFRNKVYDLTTTHATAGSVFAIVVSNSAASGVTTIYNNLIGDLKAPNISNGNDQVRGISISTAIAVASTINVYYNTIYISGTSSGASFSTSGVFHAANATANIATLDLRNNIIVNFSTPKGAGRAVALRRSSNVTTNYASTSNNNLYYAGTPGTGHYLLSDATNADINLTNFSSHLGGAETLSVTEDISSKVLSTTGSSALFLHINDAVVTAVESGAVNITGITDDYDGQIRAGNPGFTGSSTAPDIGADEIFGTETTPPVISYTLLANTTSTSNVTFSSVTITDVSGVNTIAGTKPRVYYKRLTDANAWADNTSTTNGWKFTEATNGASPFSFTIDYSLLFGGATGIAGAIQYFVVAQDAATVPNVGINSGTFANAPTTVALTASAFPLTGTINSYLITFSGTYKVGSTEVFTSLTKANGLFAAINTSGLGANIVVNITSNLSEDGAVALNAWTETGPGNYTVTIQPSAATFRTISGDAVGGLIRFNDADRVTIDGRSGGSGSYLKFSNTNNTTSTGTAFTFINGASNNTIRNSDIQAATDSLNGAILFSTSSSATGNSNNLIDNCTINSTFSFWTGKVAVYSAGTTGKENSDNTISNSTIHSYSRRAIDVTATGSTGWTITGNSLYDGDVSGAIAYPKASTLHGVRILGGSGYTITNNFIGGSQVGASGSAAAHASSTGDVTFTGIALTTSSATPASSIKSNTITNLTVSTIPTGANSTAFIGIDAGGSGITIGGSGEGNTVGSTSANSTIVINTSTTSAANTSVVTGINVASSGGSVISNKVGGIDITNAGTTPAFSTVRGIRVNSATAPSISGNIVGSTTVANSIQFTSTSASTAPVLQGISVGATVASPVSVDNNTVQNLSNQSTTSSGSFVGINIGASSSATMTISANIVRDISAASNANANSGIYNAIFSQSPSTITGNTITNIIVAATGTAVQLRGIAVSGSVTHSITNNTISGLSTASTKTANIETNDPNTYALVGILNSAGASSQVISGNTIFSLTTTSAANTNVALAGIATDAASGDGTIFQNRIHGLVNNATGSVTLPGISGISAFNGTFIAYNNAIKVDNSPNTNAVKVYGIVHATTNGWNYYYNTVVVAGNTGSAARAAAFIRTVTGAVVLRNNVLQNTRTGSGPNFAISNPGAATNWSGSASDYNDFYSTGSVGEWGATPSTLAQWQSSSAGDSHSANQQILFITSTHDLEPTTNANCLINNTATPIASPISITVDINNITRSGTPDIGAYEFSYVTVVITAGNDGPVCDASIVNLTVNPGALLTPTYSWMDPLGAIVSSIQNPAVNAVAGDYTATVTDANGCATAAITTVVTLARPTSVISGTANICSGSSTDLQIDLTGTGTVHGVLSSGDIITGTVPQIIFPVSPAGTTIYTVTSLSDDNCTSLPADLTSSATVSVTEAGQWLGIVDANWDTAGNWCGGIPTSSIDVTVVSGTPFSPEISAPGALAQALTIDGGAVLLLTGAGTLDLKGDLTNNGDFNIDAGTTVSFSGTNTQSINGNLIKFYNIGASNTASPGVQVESDQELYGVLTLDSDVIFDADGSGDASLFTVKSSGDAPTVDASIGALPSGASITGSVTVERFMSLVGPNNTRIYRYISSPVQNGTVADIQNEIPVTGTFTGTSNCVGCLGAAQSMFAYDETVTTDSDLSGTADFNDGYIDFPADDNTETLEPGRGYAIYVRGDLLSTGLWNITGPISQGNVAPVALPVNYTSSGNILNDGWNLVGNPYPSAIDWEAAGWTKTNLDATIYLADNTQPLRQYATWNGVVGTNGGSQYLATGQGFYVKANSASPALSASESVKTSTSTSFFRVAAPENLLRITMKQGAVRDEAVIHFRDDATAGFDSNADALKLPNGTFNLSSLANTQSLAINSLPVQGCSGDIKLNVTKATAGNYSFNFSQIESFGNSMSIKLTDKFTSTTVDLLTTPSYSFSVTAATTSYGSERFVLSFANQKYDATAADGSVCTEGTVQLTASGAPAGGRYNWYESEDSPTALPGTTALFTTPVLTESHSYFVTAVDRWGCEGPRSTVLAEVKTPPSINITVVDSVLTSSSAEGNQWLLNDIALNGQTASTFKPVKSGSYKVHVTAANGCDVTSDAFPFTVTEKTDTTTTIDPPPPPPDDGTSGTDSTATGTNPDPPVTGGGDTVTGLGDDKEFSVKFVPNPVSDKLTVIVTRAAVIRDMRIANQLGQFVGKIQVQKTADGATGEFSMKDLPAGVYIVQVVADGFVHTERIVKL